MMRTHFFDVFAFFISFSNVMATEILIQKVSSKKNLFFCLFFMGHYCPSRPYEQDNNVPAVFEYI